jgi:hypothetical protein
VQYRGACVDHPWRLNGAGRPGQAGEGLTCAPYR